MPDHIIYNKDCRDMSELADNSVHLIVTSPPYWSIKDYNSDHQIGFSSTYQQYVNDLNVVLEECVRVLKNGCKLCINIGDQFLNSKEHKRFRIIPIRTDIINKLLSLKLDYMGSIIWKKQTTITSKGAGGESVLGSYPYPRNGVIHINYEFILVFKKLGKPDSVPVDIKELSMLSKDEWREYFNGHWSIGGAKQKGNLHQAVFPVEIPKRLIKMFSFVGETVLDPFVGSGTTSVAADRENRNSIGYEINPDFVDYSLQRLQNENPYSTITLHK